MTSLLIRNVDRALHARLKARAAEHRHSLEEEARELLRAAVARQEDAGPRENLIELARRLFGPEHGAGPRHPSSRRCPETPAVFVGSQAQDAVFTAAICEAEIHYGLARMPPGRRRDELTVRITAFLAQGFQAQILHFDSAELYGEIRSGREAVGKPITVEDCMIAATARAHSAIVATRNVADF